MSLNRSKAKGRRETGRFVALPLAILESQEYARLNGNAVKALVDLFSQYNGKNNGDFTAAWSVMQKRGWKSKATLYSSLNLLLDLNWIVKTRQGGKHMCTLYAVTWQSIDPCDGKLDIKTTSVASGAWKNQNPAPPVDHISTPAGPMQSMRYAN